MQIFNHFIFTVPALLCIFKPWGWVLFWVWLNSLMLNLALLSWRPINFFRFPQRPSLTDYRRMMAGFPFRTFTAVGILYTFVKFAVLYSSAPLSQKSVLYDFHFILSFFMASATSITTLKTIYVILKTPRFNIPRPTLLKAFYLIIFTYILICALIINHTTSCEMFKEKLSFFSVFLFGGAFFCLLFRLERTTWNSPIFNPNLILTKMQRGLCAAGCVYFGLLLPYSIYLYGRLSQQLVRGGIKFQDCSSYPTISLLYVVTIFWLLGLGLLESFLVLPVISKRLAKEFWLDIKRYLNALNLRIQLLSLRLQVKMGVELDSEKRARLQQLELQTRISPLTGFNYNNVPEHLIRGDDCSICLEELRSPAHKVVYWRKCLHFYHEKCLAVWTKNHRNCPLCKQPM